MTSSRLKSTSSENNWDHVRRQTSVFDARTGYDRIALAYDGSPWRRFWRKNEYPIVKKIFLRLLHKYNFKRALDIGAGTGFYTRFIENYVPSVVGVDISRKMLLVAEEKSAGTFVNQDFLEFHDQIKFEFALSARTLSHIYSIENFFRSLDEATSDDACVILTDIHPKHNYYKTKFEFGNDIIEIETYKHTVRDILDIVTNKISEQVFYKEFDFQSLRDKWISTEFRSVINSVDPVFYIIFFKKGTAIEPSISRYLRDVLNFKSFTRVG